MERQGYPRGSRGTSGVSGGQGGRQGCPGGGGQGESRGSKVLRGKSGVYHGVKAVARVFQGVSGGQRGRQGYPGGSRGVEVSQGVKRSLGDPRGYRGRLGCIRGQGSVILK